MSIEELEKFCLANAGKMAKGKDKDGKWHTGRILAFTPSSSGGWILLENTKLPKKTLPSPLPKIPYMDNKWRCVISDCHLGVPCIADSIGLFIDKIEVVSAPITPSAPVPHNVAITRVCGHTECHVDWCWKKYIGLA